MCADSYLLDERHMPSEGAYILATDADIGFKTQVLAGSNMFLFEKVLTDVLQDVTALLMMLTRDKKVGAVCGRKWSTCLFNILPFC
jgi:hypothetical protein